MSAFWRGVTSRKNGDFYCFEWFYLFRTKNKIEYHKKVCENKDFCNVIMRSEDTYILEFNQYRKAEKVTFIIQAVFECMIGKIGGCKT